MKINIIFLIVAEAERRAHFLERVEVGKWTEDWEGEWVWGYGGRGHGVVAFGGCWHISNNEREINLKFSSLFPHFHAL